MNINTLQTTVLKDGKDSIHKLISSPREDGDLELGGTISLGGVSNGIVKLDCCLIQILATRCDRDKVQSQKLILICM